MQPSDLNQDGIVNSNDLSILVSRWNTTDPTADINNDGTVNSSDLSILVSQWGETSSDPPVAAFTITPLEPVTGETVMFDASSSERAVLYEWDDAAPGDWPMGTGMILEFVYNNPGSKQPRLTVTDDQGRTNQLTIPIAVGDGDSGGGTGGGIIHGTELTAAMTGIAANGQTINDLTLHSGRRYSQYDGEVIENLLIDWDGNGTSNPGALVIQHNNVVVRNCYVYHRDGANGITTSGSPMGITVEFCSFDGDYRTRSGNFGSIGISGNNIYSYRNYFQGGRDGIHLGDNCRVEENYIYDLHVNPDAHTDGVHSGGASSSVIIRNNVPAGNTSGLSLLGYNKAHKNIDMFDNCIRGVGIGYGLYGGYLYSYRENIEYVRIEGNRFTGTFQWGTNAAVNPNKIGNAWDNNRFVGSSIDEPANPNV